MDLRGITVSVGYASTLAITLPRNIRHAAEWIVATSPEDRDTAAVVESVPGARLFVTDAFTRHGARFNKGLALEECFDFAERTGRLLILDADILLPPVLDLKGYREGQLHGASRRILEDPSQWREDLDWRSCPRWRDGGPIGFFQLFDAESPHVRDRRPWYDVSFAHAGGGDAYFMDLFPSPYRRMLPIDVLHLGPVDRNWFGTDEESRRIMDAFVIRNGWHRAAQGRDREAAASVGEIVERVSVPGYPPSGYELPFVRRAQRDRVRTGQ